MATAEALDLASLYRSDETAWLEVMADLVRAGRLDRIDAVNLAEFLESMANRDRRQVSSRLTILLAHLLKWSHQPDLRSRSWRTTVATQRLALNRLLSRGVLRAYADEVLAEVYRDAASLAAIETSLPISTFPAACPFTLDAALSGPLEGDARGPEE